MSDLDVLKQLVGNAPVAIAIILLVRMFLAWIQEYMVAEKTRTELVAKALEKNTEMLGRAVEVMTRASIALENSKRGS